MKPEIQKIQKQAEIELKRLDGIYKRELIERNIDNYAEMIRKYHFMGVNVLRHSHRLSDYYKELFIRDRDKPLEPPYERFGVCTEEVSE